MDSQILIELAEEQVKALEAFAKAANAIIDRAFAVNETIVDSLEQQKRVLLNQ